MAGPTQEALIQGLCSVVASATGLTTCLWSGARPALPYAIVQQITPGTTSHREEREDDATGLITFRRHKRAVYQVDVLAPGPNRPDFVAGAQLHPTDYLLRLEAAKDMEAHKTTMRAAGGVIVDVTEPADFTRLVDTEHEYRAVSRVTVAYRWDSDPVDQSTIEEVEGSFDVGGLDYTLNVEPD